MQLIEQDDGIPGANTAPRPRLQGFDDGFVVDTSEREPVYLLTTADGRYLRLSQSAFRLLQMMERGMPAAAVAQHFGCGGRAATPEEVEAAYHRLLDRVKELDRAVEPSPLGLRFAHRVLPAPLVRRISNYLTGAFEWAPAFALLCFLAFAGTLYAYDLRSQELKGLLPYFWSGYGLFWISLVAHEFGHAAACARFGARPADIGIGVYFIYPALYSDVTDAWRLTRWQRVVVDAGGIYFQALAGAVFVVAYHLTAWKPLEAAAVLIAANCLFSLNPLFKFDGYWIITDALGVTNLRADARQVVSVLWEWLRGRRSTGVRWSRGVAVAIVVCGALTATAWGMFMARVVPAVWVRLLEYPGVATAFGRDVFLHPGSISPQRVLSFLLTSLFTLLGARVFYDLLRRLWAQMARASRAALEWARRRREAPATVGDREKLRAGPA